MFWWENLKKNGFFFGGGGGKGGGKLSFLKLYNFTFKISEALSMHASRHPKKLLLGLHVWTAFPLNSIFICYISQQHLQVGYKAADKMPTSKTLNKMNLG